MDMESSSWLEDSVVFRGVIRRSGNSLAITIPSELIQRFQLKEGQEFVMLGMSRLRPDFEGAIQVYLGYFTVYEKVYGIEVVVKAEKNASEVLKVLERLAAKHGSSRMTKQLSDDGSVKVRIFFGMITDGGFKRSRGQEEVESIKADILSELASMGIEAVSHKTLEEIIEWRNVDPSTISKLPHKAGEMIRWKWEL